MKYIRADFHYFRVSIQAYKFCFIISKMQQYVPTLLPHRSFDDCVWVEQSLFQTNFQIDKTGLRRVHAA